MPIKNITIDTNNPTGDAFGRFRVSSPRTLFDSKQIFNDADRAVSIENQPLFFDNQQTSGTGTTTTYDPDQASTTLAVSTAAGTRVRQTRMRFNYQPGKSLLVLRSFVYSSAPTSGVIRRIGYFDQNNGLFFEDNGVNYGFVRRTNVLGTPSNIRVAQSAWNIDRFDGSGPSGLTLDFTKTQILVTDFEWLGVGRVRLGFNVNGKTFIAHEFNNANQLGAVYMSTPNLPLREEILNNGTGAASSMTIICSSVVSEGGLEDLGIVRTFDTEGIPQTLSANNTWYAIMGLRLRPTHLGMTVNILKVAIQLQTATDKIQWGLFFNPTISAPLTYANMPFSGVQRAFGLISSLVTEGVKIDGGFLESGNQTTGAAASLSSGTINALRLGSLIDGTPDQLVLCAKGISGTTSAEVEALITFQELS